VADEAPVADRFLVASRRISCQGQPGADRPAHVGIVLADPACEDNGVDALLGLDAAGIDFGLRRQQESLLRLIDFSTELMQGMLSHAALRAGALHVDLSRLRAYRWQVKALAVGATVLSTGLVGVATWLVFSWLGVELPLLYCLLFGALISPIDPIAVMGVLKTAGAPEDLELVITDESLFNDGVASSSSRSCSALPSAAWCRPPATACSCCCGKRAAACCSALFWGTSHSDFSRASTVIRSSCS